MLIIYHITFTPNPFSTQDRTYRRILDACKLHFHIYGNGTLHLNSEYAA